jgi:hypothetical protein
MLAIAGGITATGAEVIIRRGERAEEVNVLFNFIQEDDAFT